ncbi:MAG: alpha/beta hydrolase family protein [Dermatophilaceae bacterium]
MSRLSPARWRRAVGAVLAPASVAAAATLGVSTLTASEPPDAGTAASAAERSGWQGVKRVPLQIPLSGGWTAGAELDLPARAKGPVPVVVLFHGSGRNDLDQTLPGPDGTTVRTFPSIAQALARKGVAVLRFNKRGVVGVGPKLSDDPRFTDLAKPYTQYLEDAAGVVKYATGLKHVDPKRIYLLGHSEGTNIASELAADPGRYGIRVPAGVVTMGIIGVPAVVSGAFQTLGSNLAVLHEEFDVDANGLLTPREVTDGLAGRERDEADEVRSLLLSGEQVSPELDTDRDGRLAIDTEVKALLAPQELFDAYPEVDVVSEDAKRYGRDVGSYPDVSQNLPKYRGPALLLNGENDIQTPVRGAYVADDALERAGNPDHTLKVYPGIGHAMNYTLKWKGDFGDPDRAVVRDIVDWVTERAR